MIGLLESMRYNAIIICVNRLIKIRYFVPTTNEIIAEGTTNLFINNVYRLHRFPNTVISDRGPQFNSLFWKTLCKYFRIDRLLLTAFHPKIDRQTENANAMMEAYLRAYITYLQDNWVKWLPLAEFAANNAELEVLRYSSFFANYGYNPSFGFKPHAALARAMPLA